jgi:hypothetical protein
MMMMMMIVSNIRQRPVQLDEFGNGFMRPGYDVSHHANIDDLTKKERKPTKQTGLYSSVSAGRDDSSPSTQVTTCKLQPPGRKSSDCRFIGS